jgi:hypothetical protein
LARLGPSLLLCACVCPSVWGCGGSGGSDDEPATDGIVSASNATMNGTEGVEETTMAPTMGSSEETMGPPVCGESQFVLEVVPTRVMLVLDKSGSMVSNTWDHDADATTEEVTRWSSLYTTVELVTTAFNGAIEFGALLYPSLEATSTYDEFACLVSDAPEVLPAPENAMAVMDALPGPDETESIQGGTPSATAVGVALVNLLSVQEQVPRAILFITDGEANCRADATVVTELFEDYDESLHTVVEDAWLMEEIPTYVVGIAIRDEILPDDVDGAPDGINPNDQLDLLAEQGGRPREGGETLYYATDNQVELEAALAEIVGQQFDCSVGLEPEPEFPQFVEIEIGGEPVERIDDCATEDGWLYTNPDGPYDSIELCGAACDLLAAEGTLDAIYACPPPE